MSEKFRIIMTALLVSLMLTGFGAAGIIKKDNEISETERRRLAQTPEMTSETVLSGEYMTSFETHALDQFPLREKFRKLKAITSYYVIQKKDNNSIIISDGYASKLDTTLDEKSVKHASDRFRYVYDKYLSGTDSQVYYSVIPDKNYFISQKGGYPLADYEKLTELYCSQMDFAEYIDIFPELSIEDYYRTDTHWKQECIYDAAKILAEKMGTPLSAEYETETLDADFYGVYYGQAALPMRPDKITIAKSSILDACTVFDFETNRQGAVYTLEKAHSTDPYEVYLSGPKALLTIESPEAKTDKSLIIFRDSFSSSIAPYFAEGYSKITLIDIRYIYPDMLGNFVDFSDSDVLFLYSTLVLNSSTTIK